MEDRKTIVLVIPSDIVARGLKGIIEDAMAYRVEEVFHDLSKPVEARLRTLDPDVVLIDPSVFDFKARKDGRDRLAEICDSIVIALDGPDLTDEALRRYDGYVSIYDSGEAVIRKLDTAFGSRQSDPSPEGGELSAREKEILVCVATGMLNKEIADKLNLSIYTVITHRKNITRKTGIKTVAGLTVYALLNGLIDISSVQ